MKKKIFILGLCLVNLPLAFFSFSKIAQAVCTYSLVLSSPTSGPVSPGSNVQFTAKLSRSGSCDPAERATVNLIINSRTPGAVSIARGELFPSSGGSIEKTVSVLVQPSNFTDPANMEFYARAIKGWNGPEELAKSNSLKFAAVGGGVVPNSVSGSIEITPSKGEYNKSDVVKITYKVNSSQVLSLPASVTNIYYVFKVNGTTIYEDTKARGVVAAGPYADITITDGGAFKNNGNAIEASIWVPGSSVRLGMATANMTVAGLATPPPSPPGGGGGGGAGTGTPAGGRGGGGAASGTSPTADCTKADADANRCLYNPLPQSDLTKMFLFITRGFLTIIGIWGVMFLIVGGFRLITSAGNEEQLIAAKKTITWAILGVLVAIMSFSIIAMVQNLVTNVEIKKVNTGN